MINIKSQLTRLFVQLPSLASKLSKGGKFKSVGLYVKFVYFTFSRKFFVKNKPLLFSFVFNNRTFKLELLSNLDTAVLVEIFVLNEYEWRPKISTEIKNILDLGAHWGDTALYYALTYENAQIFSIEPMLYTYNRLENIAAQFSSIKPIQGALCSHSGKVIFFYSENSIGNSLIERNSDDGSVEVPALTIDDIVNLTKVKKFDLVKFDIEGAETVLFNSGCLKELSCSYIGEVHLDLIDMTLEDIKEKFVGFEVDFKMLKKTRYILTASAL